MIKKKVTSLLSCLTENQQEVVYLKYMIGLQHKEIAEMLDIQEESARKILHRAMEKLRKSVKFLFFVDTCPRKLNNAVTT